MHMSLKVSKEPDAKASSQSQVRHLHSPSEITSSLGIPSGYSMTPSPKLGWHSIQTPSGYSFPSLLLPGGQQYWLGPSQGGLPLPQGALVVVVGSGSVVVVVCSGSGDIVVVVGVVEVVVGSSDVVVVFPDVVVVVGQFKD